MMNFKVQTYELSSFVVLLWASCISNPKCFLCDMSNPSVDTFDNLSADGWEIRVVLRYSENTENNASSSHIHGEILSLHS